ncbi:hypothetical protein EOM39_06965, partial [Candidatus Gracilibacteria bacterium]|nr:hypothetical protein [Candidatus Gracilibacteria bacterium]
GRFLSRDPIDISDDVNLYTYVGNNPVMFVDRMGLEKELIIMGNPNNPNDPKEVAMFDNTVKYQIEKLMKEGVMLENIELIGNVMTPEQFNNAVKKYLGNIKSITYMAHGTQYTTGDITIDNVSELNSIKVDSNDNPSIMLLSCQTGKGNNSIAQNLSNTLGVNVNAPTVNVAVYDKEDFEYSFDNIIYHGDLVIKGMYTDIGEPTIGLIGEWKTFYPSLNLIN